MGTLALNAARTVARRKRRIDLNDKVAVVTGGSRGLGLILARQLAAAGARVAICARNAEELERAKSQLAESGEDVATFVCDVGNQADVARFMAAVESELGAVDILINNAAVMQIGPLELMETADYESAMRSNFWGALYAIEAALPTMRTRGSGRIVNISSFAGKFVPPHMLPYAVSKHALAGLSKGLRAELAPQNIFVTTVYPHLMRTGSLYHARFKGHHRTEYALGAIMSSNPLASMDAERAAHDIIGALRFGDGDVVLSRRMQLATGLGVLFPSLTTDVMSLLTRTLPPAQGEGSIGKRSLEGADSFSPLAPSILTVPIDKAAQRNNEADSGDGMNNP
jgi:NAD(P)-dependent dehydrogenase (short-subunit alcohol dehydrogenase family)